MATQAIKIALAGNPNVGKSTIFNSLTGTHQHVGNWPGKTVERKEGQFRLATNDIILVDLPGTYSLTAYSIEEIIARDFLVQDKPEVVIAVVDAANIERNLYLVTQLIELQIPIIIALNMMDLAKTRGISIDMAKLSQQLGDIPIVEVIGNRGIGIDDLRVTLSEKLKQTLLPSQAQIPYETELEEAITTLAEALQSADIDQKQHLRWMAIKLLENDEKVIEFLEQDGKQDLLTLAESLNAEIEAQLEDDAEILITDARYQFIRTVLDGAISHPQEIIETRSDKIDKLITHRIWGVPIFMALMWVVFQFTANVSAPFVDWIDGIISGPLTHWVQAFLSLLGLSDTWLDSLLVDGILAGVGGVLVFVPVLMSLYFAIGLLEDSGYMARAAFVMDRVMRAMGLHGKSFLPMLVGFGCTVPAVYATRTLENEEDRKLTGFLVTFMSCGARLPVYVIFAAVFFGGQGGNLIFALYVLGIIIALLTGYVMKRVFYRNKPPQPFVMELPPYRIPTLRDVALHMWERTSSFIRKAVTMITGMSIAIWLLLAVPVNANGQFANVEPEDSLYGSVSSTLAPIFAPAGFGEWQATGSLISGLVAKEVIIGTMNQIYLEADTPDEETPSFTDDVRFIFTSFGDAVLLTTQEIINIVPRTANLLPGVQIQEVSLVTVDTNTGDAALETALKTVFTPLSAIAFTVFVLLYVPCVTTMTAMRHEFGLRWMLYQVAYTSLIAWLGAVAVYQIGSIIGFGGI